ncbi:MAG: hypothetical protein ACT4O1_18160 [Gemmatimonadota bacterium]
MNPTRQDLLSEVADLLESHEQAIASHPPATAEVYRKARDAFLTGQETAVEEPWMRAAGLNLDDLTLLRQYMLASSFISAWYHLHGDMTQRDKAANSCALLVAGFGEDPEQVMRRYIGYEQLWRRTLRVEGIAPSRWRTPSAATLAYPLLAGFWMAGRAPLLEAVGYGVGQLGYLVAASGLIFGSFRVLGISSRLAGLGLGAALWVLGVGLVNL